MTTLQYREMPYSKGIVIHFHGGGFIAQSSKSHEVKMEQNKFYFIRLCYVINVIIGSSFITVAGIL